MEVVKFDKEIFDALIMCGFRYCYSKTVADKASPDKINIFLTPVGFKPNIRELPGEYDTYFNLTHWVSLIAYMQYKIYHISLPILQISYRAELKIEK